MKLAAVIFDLDGTVLDNEDEYGEAFRQVLKSLGKKVKAKYPHTAGIGVKENWPRLLAKYRLKTDRSVEELAQRTQSAYLKLLPKVESKKGFEKFIKDLKDSGIMTALATSNAWWIVEEVLEKLNLERFFDVVTTGEEVDYKKPDPDLFLLTAKKLGLEPDEILVIEDSQAGIEAAHRAGMKVVGMARNRKHAKELAGADLVVTSYLDLTPTKLLAL